jgi:hypothetical protein
MDNPVAVGEAPKHQLADEGLTGTGFLTVAVNVPPGATVMELAVPVAGAAWAGVAAIRLEAAMTPAAMP